MTGTTMTSTPSRSRSVLRHCAAVAAAGAASVLLVACGGSGADSTGSGHGAHATQSSSASPSASAPATPGEHNAADTAFAQGMIPHHRQAVEMAELASTRAGSAEVKKLADEIRKAQDPEIRMLSGWLTAWGEQVPAEGSGDHSAHGDGAAGMMSAQEMDGLKAASGGAFDTAFMELMIKHHEGAVAMARTEQAQGSFPAARTMAETIVSTQSAEIAHMNKLLGRS
ncbi:DUF305 domain-containing protein [Streptomyces sp. NPDC093224]|uniref:DUF305 domain-containing protein n=1 Tax=Streptomyces sp. NPDC093224 TaxID=3155198 RepID=UPI0034238900